MMKNIFLTLVFSWLFFNTLTAQIINGTDTLYGNEWIKFDQSYFKLMVAEDGIYRIGYQELTDAGLPVTSIIGSEYQLFHNGDEVPIYTSTSNIFSPTDYLEFYGQKNRSELDQYLFQNPDEEMMNPLYSLFTDTSAYFLTWTNVGTPLRYEEVGNDLTNLPAKEPYYLEEHVAEYHSSWDKEKNGQGVSVSNFTMAEGYSSNYANIQSFNLVPTFPYINGPGSKLHIRYAGNLKQHSQQISLNGQILTTDNYYGYAVRKLDFDIDNSLLNGTMELKFQGLTDNNDRQRISNIILTYPRTFNFNNSTSFLFNIKSAGINKYLEIENFNAGNSPILYDLTNNKRQIALPENGLVKINLLPSQNNRTLSLINSEEGVKKVNAIEPIDFINYEGIDANFIFLSNPKLYDDGNGNNYVQEYADYRSSQIGGGYKTIIVDVQQIFDQFGWGINRHSLSIRNFAHYAKKEWEEVQYFFVVGKGREYTAVRTGTQLGSTNNVSFYVPTFGVPGADNQMLAGGDGFTPVVPVGRIPASEAKNIFDYLQKIKEFESNVGLSQTIEDRSWMKRVLHLGGGASVGEQNSIRNNLYAMDNIITNNNFGAEVKSFFKTSTDPIQQSQTASIFDFINGGTSLITFYGHSSVGVFDFTIDLPENYDNKGKYPLMLSLGCYSGNSYSPQIGVGEKFVFLPDKGSIAFAASSGQGYISSLFTFSSELYDRLSGVSYGKSLGELLQETIAYFQNGDYGVDLIRQQFNYTGDPAIRLNPAPGPDFTIDAASVKLLPEIISTNLDSFDLIFQVINIGKGVPDSMVVEIVHERPDGLRQVVEKKIKSPLNTDEIKVRLSTTGSEATGANFIYISTDSEDSIEELPAPMAEMNNQLKSANGTVGHTFYISNNNALPVFPRKFAIVGQQDVELRATTNPLLPTLTYLFELDTTRNFNSPLKVTNKVTQSGGVIRWQPSMNWENERVYYWRISPDSLSTTEGYVWNESSFVYLSGSSPGWNQSHFYQLNESEFVNTQLLTHNNFEFINNFKDIVANISVQSVAPMTIYLNNSYHTKFYGVPNAGFNVIWLDSVLVDAQPNYASGSTQGEHYGVPYSQGLSNFLFETETPNGRKQLMDFLNDVVGPGDHVVLTSIQKNLSSDYKPQDWESDTNLFGENLFDVLAGQGATEIQKTLDKGAVPYVFAFQKDKEVHFETVADTITEILNVSFGIPGNWDRGYVESNLVGPALEWNKVIWQATSDNNPMADTISLEVRGLSADLQIDSVLMTMESSGELDIAGINAEAFPYLRLKFNTEDSLFRTSAKLDYWRVLFKGVPEFAFNPAQVFELHSDTLHRGENLRLDVALENLSDVDGDSLLIKYVWTDASNKQNESLIRMQPLSALGSDVAQLNLPTFGLEYGTYQFLVEINPDDDQPEQTHLNNFLQTGFYISKDERNPVLDVTFDGLHILNGDLVSAKPHIVITSIDENPFLLMNDTSLFKLFLVSPDTASQELISFTDPRVNFIPASSANNNRAVVEFDPEFTTDGVYTLLVQASDVSGNASGVYDYKIDFEVVTKSSISNFLPYPNPFTTSAKFLYTMTGSEPPARFKLQIMTVSGRIIREIGQEEIGQLVPGTHLTDFSWDGTDQFGDQLAKGVYLYRVLVEDEMGKEWEAHENGTDKYFKNSTGKIVLLR